jgi:hypothetical protein
MREGTGNKIKELPKWKCVVGKRRNERGGKDQDSRIRECASDRLITLNKKDVLFSGCFER